MGGIAIVARLGHRHRALGERKSVGKIRGEVIGPRTKGGVLYRNTTP